MRLAPGAAIAEHHHPSHDETFFVHRGTVTALLDGREHTVRAGDVVHIPSGTVIQGRNAGPEEAVVVVVFAANGRGGPLTVPGHPQH
jgi:quercetin dioxygenase-like cupin family protein